MAVPRKEDMDRLVRLGKYLAAHPRYILNFGKHKDAQALHGYGDSDFAGEILTRKSTSGGMVCIGDHLVNLGV